MKCIEIREVTEKYRTLSEVPTLKNYLLKATIMYMVVNLIQLSLTLSNRTCKIFSKIHGPNYKTGLPSDASCRYMDILYFLCALQ